MAKIASVPLALAAAGLVCASVAAKAGEPVKLEARLAQPVMKSGETQTNYLRVSLAGCKPDTNNRTPVNVSFVIDRSGSMQGMPLAQAREAAIMAINRLGPNDIASVVTFDDRVELLAPAQKVTDAGRLTDLVRTIGARGSTAIHAGVVGGAYEVRRNHDPKRLNRVILLSDGQANIGPSRVGDFITLGRTLLNEGISVSTVGLGMHYNEDLMLQLARASDGNHAFARDPSELIAIFNKEFDDVLGSCAQTVSIDLDLKPGVKVVRALSREGAIDGSKAQFKMAQIYAATEHYLLVEVELDKALASGEQDLGIVKVAYTSPQGGERRSLDAPVRGRFSADEKEVDAAIDVKVSASVVEQITRSRAQEAVILRDKGRHEEARQMFLQNATDIQRMMATMPSAMPAGRSRELLQSYEAMSQPVDPAKPGQLNLERKMMRALDAAKAGAATRY